MTNEDKVNDFAIKALAILAKVLHHPSLKGTELRKEVLAVLTVGINTPFKIKFENKDE